MPGRATLAPGRGHPGTPGGTRGPGPGRTPLGAAEGDMGAEGPGGQEGVPCTLVSGGHTGL